MRVAWPDRGISLLALLGACDSVPYRVLERGDDAISPPFECTDDCCTPWMEIATTPEDAALLLGRRLSWPDDLANELRDDEQLLFSWAPACPVPNVRYRITGVKLAGDVLLVDHHIHVPTRNSHWTSSHPYEVIALPLQPEGVTYESTFTSNYPPPGFGE